jgi:hypothetical protein
MQDVSRTIPVTTIAHKNRAQLGLKRFKFSIGCSYFAVAYTSTGLVFTSYVVQLTALTRRQFFTLAGFLQYGYVDAVVV